MSNDKLAGDHLEDFFKKIGADKVAKKISKNKSSCNKCARRKQKINKVHEKIRNKGVNNGDN